MILLHKASGVLTENLQAQSSFLAIQKPTKFSWNLITFIDITFMSMPEEAVSGIIPYDTYEQNKTYVIHFSLNFTEMLMLLMWII